MSRSHSDRYHAFKFSDRFYSLEIIDILEQFPEWYTEQYAADGKLSEWSDICERGDL